MKLLLFGGTAFLGRAITEIALERGHEVSLFHRGKTNAALFPEAEHILGDRTGDLAELRGRSWHAAIDVMGMCSPDVRRAAELLAEQVEHYTFVSTISVYADHAAVGVNEDYQRATMEGSEEHLQDMPTYGARKARCEDVVREIFGEHSLIVRPGMIVGPYDYTGRFNYWVERFQEPGTVLAPEPADQPIQVIDARDLAAWILDLVEQRDFGTYHATGPAQPLTMQALIEACRAAQNSTNDIAWLPQDFLLEQGVVPFADLPFWLAENPEYAGIFQVNIERALQAGLTFRPLEETVRAIVATSQTADTAKATGLAREREQTLIETYQQKE